MSKPSKPRLPSSDLAKLRSLSRGETVFHAIFGEGKIVEEWGSWFSCRGCYLELKPAQLHKIIRSGKEVITGQCDDCAAKALYRIEQDDDSSIFPLQVSGKGTFDVLFQDGKIRAINQHWLKPLEEQQAA